MKTETTIDILSEDFEIPDCNCDILELIESSIEQLKEMPYNRGKTTAFKRKINELINEYNDRRNMKIFQYV